jgi:hypothetical protein
MVRPQSAAPGGDAPATGDVSPTPTSAEAPADAAPDQAWEGEGWSQYGTSRRNNGAEHDFDFSDITPADLSLRDHLLAQSNGSLHPTVTVA